MNLNNIAKGRKTYIGVLILAVIGVLRGMGVIDQQTFDTIAALAGGLAAFGIRKNQDNL